MPCTSASSRPSRAFPSFAASTSCGGSGMEISSARGTHACMSERMTIRSYTRRAWSKTRWKSVPAGITLAQIAASISATDWSRSTSSHWTRVSNSITSASFDLASAAANNEAVSSGSRLDPRPLPDWHREAAPSIDPDVSTATSVLPGRTGTLPTATSIACDTAARSAHASRPALPSRPTLCHSRALRALAKRKGSWRDARTRAGSAMRSAASRRTLGEQYVAMLRRFRRSAM